MNLTVKDIAGLLNISEKTVYRMIQSETIPCFRVGGQWRFDKREILSWIEDAKHFSISSAEKDASAKDEESISLGEFLRRGGIYHDVPGASSEEVIRESLDRIKTGVPGLDADKVFSLVMEREALCSTAVGHGIAFPHTRIFGKLTALSYIALCRLERPVPFGALDNEPVDTLFFVFPKSERRFLRIQAKLLRLLKEEEVLSAVKAATNSDDQLIYDVFSRKEAEIFKAVLQ